MLHLHRIAEIKNRVGAAVRVYQTRSDTIKNHYDIVKEAYGEVEPDLVNGSSAGRSDLARWLIELEQIKGELAPLLGEETGEENSKSD